MGNLQKTRNSHSESTSVGHVKQLRVARQYLSVPEWLFTSTPSDVADGSWVTKSVTGEPIPGTGDFAKVIYTSAVDPATLASGFPWFLQRQVNAALDLTVVYVDGKQFGFTLDRSRFNGLDWRRAIGINEVDGAWTAVNISSALSDSLSNIMRDLGLRFGRIDLLANDVECNDVSFLEVNPNGQWAWLDVNQDNGLFQAVLQFLTSE